LCSITAIYESKKSNGKKAIKNINKNKKVDNDDKKMCIKQNPSFAKYNNKQKS